MNFDVLKNPSGSEAANFGFTRPLRPNNDKYSYSSIFTTTAATMREISCCGLIMHESGFNRKMSLKHLKKEKVKRWGNLHASCSVPVVFITCVDAAVYSVLNSTKQES